MEKHPIESLMNTAMSNLKEMIDVNTVVGEAIDTGNGTTIIPVSKVCFGFAAGGCEFNSGTLDQYTKEGVDEDISYKLPFGGGSGAGVSINPVAFLVVNQDGVKLMPINHVSTVDKLMDYVPDLMEKANKIVDKSLDNSAGNSGIVITSQDENKDKKQKIKNPTLYFHNKHFTFCRFFIYLLIFTTLLFILFQFFSTFICCKHFPFFIHVIPSCINILFRCPISIRNIMASPIFRGQNIFNSGTCKRWKICKR